MMRIVVLSADVQVSQAGEALQLDETCLRGDVVQEFDPLDVPHDLGVLLAEHFERVGVRGYDFVGAVEERQLGVALAIGTEEFWLRGGAVKAGDGVFAVVVGFAGGAGFAGSADDAEGIGVHEGHLLNFNAQLGGKFLELGKLGLRMMDIRWIPRERGLLLTVPGA
jgi:hypothetical protein